MNRIDGMPTEFEWKVFPGITTLGLLEKIQSLMRDLQCEPEHLKGKLKPFCSKKPTEFCFCIELIVVCRRAVSEQSLWK